MINLHHINQRYETALNTHPAKGTPTRKAYLALADSVADVRVLMAEIERLRARLDAVKEIGRGRIRTTRTQEGWKMSKRNGQPLQVKVSTEELLEWAGRHADAGHHGVAHVLYKAAEGIESITDQHDREVAAKALRDAADDSQRGPVAYGWNASGIAKWLKGRAEQIEKGTRG